MADVHNKATRSYNMSRIRSKNSKPEMLVRKFLHSQGFRYRLHVNTLPRKPDIVLAKYKAIIFVNGCFWHGHENCKKAPMPKSNANWWKQKILGNRSKDAESIKNLNLQGWRVITLWQCQLSDNNWQKEIIKFIRNP